MKYELVETENGTRVRALIDFGTVKKGDLGGYVGSEKNLSQVRGDGLTHVSTRHSRVPSPSKIKIKLNHLASYEFHRHQHPRC